MGFKQNIHTVYGICDFITQYKYRSLSGIRLICLRICQRIGIFDSQSRMHPRTSGFASFVYLVCLEFPAYF